MTSPPPIKIYLIKFWQNPKKILQNFFTSDVLSNNFLRQQLVETDSANLSFHFKYLLRKTWIKNIYWCRTENGKLKKTTKYNLIKWKYHNQIFFKYPIQNGCLLIVFSIQNWIILNFSCLSGSTNAFSFFLLSFEFRSTFL